MPTQSGIWNLKQVRDAIAGASYAQQPLIDGITGNIGGAQTTLTISGVAFGLPQGTVRFTSGATIAEVSVTPVSDVSMTVNVPQAIYDLALNSTVGIKFITGLGVQSNTFNKTVTQFGADILVIAGGGSGGRGYVGGGGGAGGYQELISQILTPATNYTVTVGAGGATAVGPTGGVGNAGSPSVFNATTSTGGGGGGSNQVNAASGGSGGGGGAAASPSTFGNGTVGQGNNGGVGFDGVSVFTAAGGGGGAGGVGGNSGTTSADTSGGNGGAGSISAIDAVQRAGGGGAGTDKGGAANYPGNGGTGGAGGGGNGGTQGVTQATVGAVNSGSGGGGASYSGSPFYNGAAGGSGVVILKYSDYLTISNPGGGLTLSTAPPAGGFKVTSVTAGTGNVSFA